jgi:2-ketocyclohexanecarboxyl-CoA hydrolase
MERYTDILYEVSAAVARITINRPDKYNAFSAHTCEELERIPVMSKHSLHA